MKASIFSLLWMSTINAQTDINFSYEMKYGDGKQVTGTASDNPDTLDYNYFENLLDINTFYGDNIYFYTQLEYSNHPVYGNRRSGLDSLVNTFYLEYSDDRINIKLGNQYELFGRGMSFYTLQNQNIDYDNSVKGLSFKYFMRENIEISALIGKGDYFYRSNPSHRETDLQLNSSVLLGSVNYTHDWLGYFQYMNTKQQLIIDPDFIRLFDGGTEIHDDIDERLLTDPELQEIFSSWISGEKIQDTVIVKNHNFNWNFYLGPFDIYVDKAWINYDKIFGDEVFGSRLYTAVYTDFMGTGITYEYKNYNTPYLIKTISNLPIVYREGSSILASRNAHTFNFGNEIGHQVDFNKNLFDNINILGNLSLSHRHQKNGMAELSIMEFLAMNEDSEIYDYYPFRQMYLELNGWALSERLYYKIGFDHYTEFNVGAKNTFAITIPTQWVLKFSNGNSLTTYLEVQDKTVKGNIPGDYTNYYLSMSYSNRGKWIVTGFYDQEISKGKTGQWPGFDFSYYLNSATQISLFYGSQKGGLICANGICAEQPGFEDGVKITFRSLF